MMNFDFSMTAGATQGRTQLPGNEIYTVKFDGCEIRDIQGVQDPTKTFKVLDIKFSNDQGYFTDTVFEPQEKDTEDLQGMYGPTPSTLKSMGLKFKHLIDATNPELGEKIDSGKQKLNAPSWDALRQLMVKATEPGKGKEMQIKLMVTSKGKVTFPSYFAGYTKSGQLYLKTRFIGKSLTWLPNELTRIQKMTSAKPSSVEKHDESSVENFDLSDL